MRIYVRMCIYIYVFMSVCIYIICIVYIYMYTYMLMCMCICSEFLIYNILTKTTGIEGLGLPGWLSFPAAFGDGSFVAGALRESGRSKEDLEDARSPIV